MSILEKSKFKEISLKKRFMLLPEYTLLFAMLYMIIIIAFYFTTVSQLKSELASNAPVLLLGLIGLVVLQLDLIGKRKIQNAELERVIERQKYIDRTTEGIGTISQSLADNIAKNLTEDTKWASSALEKANLRGRGQSLFIERMAHFREEKEHLASKFTPLILERCKHLIESDCKVFLIIDSGTTLYPFFDTIGKHAVRVHELGQKWLKDELIIVTNNLAGLDLLIESARINPNHRYSPLAVNSYILPGMPVPVYSAITGDETTKAIERLKEQYNDKNPYFISLITGNWVRIRRSDPNCPVPLARGEGHLKFKEYLIKNSHESYVITPLGKLFVDISKEELNDALKFNNEDIDRNEYDEADVTDEEAKNVKLVSTTRKNGKVLSNQSTRVCTILKAKSDFVDKAEFIKENNVKKLTHILFNFDYNQSNLEFEIVKEFPHAHTRNTEFMKKFFHYPDAP